ncbi:MAG: hypothetical protein L0Z48_04315 [candidate division Zixibacteria bacterium]|nr:hypothetical protein [candidate division Zixibacteria bacterium]
MIFELSGGQRVELGNIQLLTRNCIFCPKHKPLPNNPDREHAIPESWGRDLWWGHYSCQGCGNTISKFESKLMLHPVRLQAIEAFGLETSVDEEEGLHVPQNVLLNMNVKKQLNLVMDMLKGCRSDYKFDDGKVQVHDIDINMGRLATKIMLCRGGMLHPAWNYYPELKDFRSFVLTGSPNLVRDGVIRPGGNRPLNPSPFHIVISTLVPNGVIIEVLFFGHYGIMGKFPMKYRSESDLGPEPRRILVFAIKEKAYGEMTTQSNGKIVTSFDENGWRGTPFEVSQENVDIFYKDWLPKFINK